MITKNLYDETTFVWFGEIDYMSILICVMLTPVTVVLDILTGPFQLIALIIGKIIERRNEKVKWRKKR